MNKKLLISLSSVAIAASFWACGEGEIVAYDKNSPAGIIGDMVKDNPSAALPFAGMVDEVKDSCVHDSACADEMTKAQGHLLEMSSNEEPASSESTPQSSTTTPVSSSPYNFSSRGPIHGVSSSSSALPPVQSSSSSTITPPPATGLGTCAPTTATAELNTEVKWKFSANSLALDPQQMMALKYEWTFAGVSPESSTLPSPSVKYSTAGQKIAIVKVVSDKKGTETVTCSPLNVNGAKITGCECTTAAPSVDFTADPNVTWTATGCKSTVTPLVYEWDGGAPSGEASYTKTFTAAQNGYAPTLKVSHADNTIITVQCPAVKTTAGPEYQLTVTGNQLPEKAVNVKNEGCIVVNGEWTNEYDKPNLKVTCEYAVQGVANLTLNMTYNGKTSPKSGGYNVQNSVELGMVKTGTLNYPSVCVTFTGGTETSTASCKLAR